MALREENLLVLAVKGTPFCDATFEHAADAVGQEFPAEFILEVLENRHRHDAGHFERLQHVGDVFVAGSHPPDSHVASPRGFLNRIQTSDLIHYTNLRLLSATDLKLR